MGSELGPVAGKEGGGTFQKGRVVGWVDVGGRGGGVLHVEVLCARQGYEESAIARES